MSERPHMKGLVAFGTRRVDFAQAQLLVFASTEA
jgi:hypothetical protein